MMYLRGNVHHEDGQWLLQFVDARGKVVLVSQSTYRTAAKARRALAKFRFTSIEVASPYLWRAVNDVITNPGFKRVARTTLRIVQSCVWGRSELLLERINMLSEHACEFIGDQVMA